MKLGSLLLLSATGMIATGAVVWTTVDPAHGSPSVAGTEGHGVVEEPTRLAGPPAPPVDHAHFQAGKTLMVEGRLGHAVLPANVDNETYLYVDVSGANAVARTRAPLDLSIVIDKSGSMAGKRLVNALAAARTAVQRLRDGDVVSVVSFNTETQVVVRPTAIDAASRTRVTDQLATIFAGGDTCISCGIDTAMNLLTERTGMVDRILLLSDGQPTAGVRDVDGFRRIAENCRRMGASVTTIGVDVGYDERVMSSLARSSNGHHFFAADPTALPTIFDREMESLTTTIANRVELAVDLAPGVFVEHVYDRVSSGSGGQIVVPLGAFAAGEHKTVLARVRVPRGSSGDRAIAAVRLRYDDLAEARAGACEGQLAARLTTDASALTPLDALVSARVSATETASTLEAANDLARNGRLDEARGVIAAQAARVSATRHVAMDAAPRDKRADVERAFGANEQVLAGAGSGFAGGGDAGKAMPAAPAQIKQNQADALHLSD